MAESESIDCPCSNIAIMQLFHELKQCYPTIPDQIVSKVIQENYHDKNACETILRKESHAYLQSYPGAIISGNTRESPEVSSLCSQCPAARTLQQNNDVTPPPQCPVPGNRKQETAFSSSEGNSTTTSSIYTRKKSGTGLVKDVKTRSSENKAENLLSASESETEALESLNSSRTCCSECESEKKSECSRRSQSCGRPSASEVETVRWNGGMTSGGSNVSVHNYQVAVQYSMQPALPFRQGSQQRSFTTVNLSLRPPSSEPQPPIEIQSGQNLTYTTSVFDAKKGVQSQLQIRIGPGGGGTVSACRTYISSSSSCCSSSSPHARFPCRSPCCCPPQISAGFQCQNHLKALLEKQRERKDLLARELRKEKEKLRFMQNEIRVMKASISQKPSPHLLPKLKSEIERLRAECERLTAAVDLYSDSQNNLPLGETDEQFYRNIYTGQRLQREGSWSCQLCTFRNHPLLSVCEECEMPRISLGTQVMDVTSHLSVLSNNNNSFCTGGGTSTSASLITAPLQVEVKRTKMEKAVEISVKSWYNHGFQEQVPFMWEIIAQLMKYRVLTHSMRKVKIKNFILEVPE